LGEYVGLATRVGFEIDFHNDCVTIPVEINGIFGKKHCLELGAGQTFFLIKGDFLYTFFRVGYRYRAESGFLFRIAPMAYLTNLRDYLQGERNTSLQVFPWIGISIGYSF